MTRVLDRLERVLVAAEVALLAALTVVVSYQVASRYVGPIPRVLWTEEVSRFCFVWLLFLGAAVAVRRDTHFTIDVWLEDRVPRLQRVLDLVVPVAVALAAAVIVLGGLRFTALGVDRVSTTSGISLAVVYAALPVAGAAMLAFAVERLVRLLRGLPVRHDDAVAAEAEPDDAPAARATDERAVGP